MKNSLYSKIAWNNLKNNYRFFIPRILAEGGLLACFYIALTLAMDDRMTNVRGGGYISIFMGMGTAILAMLSFVMMLYINSFLMKQRKREFGVYNILGMEKRHVGKVMFYENMYSSLFSIGIGLVTGAMFYKICSLLICKLLDTDIVAGFYYITPRTLIPAAGLFLLMDLLILLFNRIRIARMKPVELLASRSTGEREPKVKLLLLLIGAASLIGGYYISITTVSPLKAMLLFFFAVVLVILGTYCLFVAGSIFLLKCLKKNETYYYNRKHMVAVSGLLYRMKQNAVGLASIAILATGVLVMISTTVSLYSGVEETLDKNFPQHYYVSASWNTGKDVKYFTIPDETLREIVRTACEENGVEIASMEKQDYLSVAYNMVENVLSTDRSKVDFQDNLTGFTYVTFLTEDTYVRLGGEPLNLAEDEVRFCPQSGTTEYDKDTIILDGQTYKIKKSSSSYSVLSGPMISTFRCYEMVVADDVVLDKIYQAQLRDYGEHASKYTNQLAVTFVDIKAASKVGEDIEDAVSLGIRDYIYDLGYEEYGYGGTSSRWDSSEAVYGMYGTLLFLGILLGLVCMFATVLIIYYKQISEGYEDRERFQIMQKIGMSDIEVKRSINTQILLVFFLPLLTAGVHLIFAFPILERLLLVLLLPNRMLFVTCSLITFAVFALIYVLIYTGTSKTYYKIVHLKSCY